MTLSSTETQEQPIAATPVEAYASKVTQAKPAESKQKHPPTITMVFDLLTATKTASAVPEYIKVNFPSIVTAMEESKQAKSRFFGFVIVPGEKRESHSGFAKGLDSFGLLVHGLCEFSKQYGNASQWMVVADKKTTKDVKPIIDKISKEIKVGALMA